MEAKNNILDTKEAVENFKKNIPKGQTKMARHFQLTLNQIETWDFVKNYIVGLKTFKYGIATKEIAPTTGHEHIHFYVRFSAPLKLSFKKLYGAHVELCRGSPRENVDYIKKVNDPEKRGDVFYEEGELDDKWNSEKFKDRAPTIKEVKEMPKEERECLGIQYYKQIEAINLLEENQITGATCSKKVKVVYIYGPSGSGKTLWAKYKFKDIPFDIVKRDGDFWHGMSGINEACLYDDFRDSHMKPSEFINFIDYTIHPMNVKGGSMKNKYKYIIITSVQHPEDLYKGLTERDAEPMKQWLRRMKTIDAEQMIGPDDITNMLMELGLIGADADEDPNDPFKDLEFDNLADY